MRQVRGRGALSAGFEALGHWRLAVLALAATVLPALLVASSLWPALRDGFGRTLAGEHVLRNDPFFAPAEVADFFHDRAAAISGTWNAARVAALFGILVQVFFAGGFVRSLGRPIRPRIGDFLEGSRRDFGHNLKCLFLFLLASALVIGLWIEAVAGAGKALQDRPPGNAASLALRIVGVVIAVLLYAVLSLWHDFARAARRIDPSIRAWRAYGFARRRLSGRWPAAIGIFLFWLLIGGVAFVVLFAATWSLPAVSAAGVLLLFLLQLASLSVRPLVRVAAWGSYIALLERASFPSERLAARAPVLVPLPEPEIAALRAPSEGPGEEQRSSRTAARAVSAEPPPSKGRCLSPAGG